MPGFIDLDAKHLLHDSCICIVMNVSFPPMPYFPFSSSFTHGPDPAEGFFPLTGNFSKPALLVLDQALGSVARMGTILISADSI